MFPVTIRRLPICLEGMRWGSGKTPWTFREWVWHWATLPLYLLPTPIRRGGYWGKNYRQSSCAKRFCILSYSNSNSCGSMEFTFLNCPFRGNHSVTGARWSGSMHQAYCDGDVMGSLSSERHFPISSSYAVIIILHTWGMSFAEICTVSHCSVCLGFITFCHQIRIRVRDKDGKPFYFIFWNVTLGGLSRLDASVVNLLLLVLLWLHTMRV